MKCNCKQHEACKVIWQAKWHHFCVVTIICHTPNLWMSRVALLMLVACSFQAHNNKWPTFLLLILLNLCVVSHWWWIINFPNFPKNRRCTQICSRIQSLCFFKSFLAMYLPQNFDECFSCEFFFFHGNICLHQYSIPILSIYWPYNQTCGHACSWCKFIHISNEFVIFIKILSH